MIMIMTAEEIGVDLTINSFVNTFFDFFIKLINNLSKMKKFSLSLVIFFVSLTITSQSTYHGDWKFLNGSNQFYLYTTEGSGIENFNEIPDFTIAIEKNSKGSTDIRLDAASIYRYQEGYNYVKIECIIDNGDIIEFSGEIRRVQNDDGTYRTRVYFDVVETGFYDFFDMMENARNLWVRTTGGDVPIVFKFPLYGFKDGFSKLFNSWREWKDNNENPFDSKNPFRN